MPFMISRICAIVSEQSHVLNCRMFSILISKVILWQWPIIIIIIIIIIILIIIGMITLLFTRIKYTRYSLILLKPE